MHLPISSWKKTMGARLAPWLKAEAPEKVRLFDPTGMSFLMITAIFYFIAYLQCGIAPSNSLLPTADPGWWGWHDQRLYYQNTIALFHWQLQPSDYWFGYPMLGVPFYWLMPRHPYFVPDTLLVLTMIGSFFAVCRQYMSRIEAWGLVLIAIFAQGILRESCLIIPWNTLPAYAAIYLSAYLLIFSRQSTLLHFALCALAAGEAVFSRPNEIIPLVLIYSFALSDLNGRDRWWAAAFFGCACAIAGLITVSLNLYFYNQVSSPYMQNESHKFHIANFGLKAYQLLCDGTFLTGKASVNQSIITLSILERYPLLLLLVPGAIYAWKTCGSKIAGLFLAIAATLTFYLTYSCCDNMPYCWSYSSFHYFYWILPWLFFLTYLTFRQAPFALKRTTYFIALLAPMVFVFVIGFKATTACSSDSGKSPLTVTTAYNDRTFTVNLLVPKEVNAMDIRLKFNTPPSYNCTRADSVSKIAVLVNGERAGEKRDYFTSQDGNTCDFSFLMHGLSLHPGDRITLTFADTTEPSLAQASLQVITFAPGGGAGRLMAAARHSIGYHLDIVSP